jgi:quinol-cytochrome oxidoreductase complex cytochrome b subunit
MELDETAFFLAGGLLAVFAVLVSVLGFQRPGFPAGRGAARGVIALGTLLVAATVVTSVLTS